MVRVFSSLRTNVQHQAPQQIRDNMRNYAALWFGVRFGGAEGPSGSLRVGDRTNLIAAEQYEANVSADAESRAPRPPSSLHNHPEGAQCGPQLPAMDSEGRLLKGSGLWAPTIPMLLLRSPRASVLPLSPRRSPAEGAPPLVPPDTCRGALVDPFTGGDPFSAVGVVGEVPGPPPPPGPPG